MQDHILLKEKYALLIPHLDEKTKRLYLASEAIGFGRGGIVKVAKLSKLSRVTIAAGIKELRSNTTINSGKTTKKNSIRKQGGGRKKAIETNEGLLEKLRELVCPHTIGDPMRALLWTSKSTRKLAIELKKSNFIGQRNAVN